ncbi:asparagine synthetase [glutamine-hydrolyzing] 1 [Abditibacteriota bacterium]|nr:asparagine synthetase [glutamine-hydrolyzing] 1 [Abditibacteriota bacterium]
MCGIAGIILNYNEALGDSEKRVSAMAQAMYHRGPDDGGTFLSPDGRVALASRRLAIQDLSPAGHMPMSNPAQTVWIVYNGEIYNAAQLRPELEGLGYSFRSSSDTEVILRAYEAWGSECVHRFRGMFAFAIFDRRSETAPDGRVFIARDRLGIKPLYYALTSKGFVFASELKGMQASGLTSRELSPSGLIGYLMLGAVPNPLTIYRDIHALEPGHTLTLELAVGRVTPPQPQRYWSLPTDTVEPSSYQDAVEQVRHLLQESVRIRLVSDVPLGAFLSGGLDSSGVVALMRQATAGPIRTCSMVFEEAEYSEAPYARAMAEAVGAEHFERTITAQDLTNELDNIFRAMDQPTLDGVNTYFVSQTARQAGLTVALSGLGGDELFGGYPSTFHGVPSMMRHLHRAQSVPGGAALARGAIQLLPNRHRGARVREALGRPLSPASAYLTRRGLFSREEVKALLAREIWEEGLREFDAIEHIAARANCNGMAIPPGGNVFEWTSRAELTTYTHHQLLRDTDAMSMAHSLEVRVPLLDHHLVETSLRLPSAIKRRGEGPKPMLGAALHDILPPVIRDRRDKQGFTFPFDKWIQGMQTDFAAPVGADVWQHRAVKGVWDHHAAGRMHWSRAWALAAVNRWESANY